MLLIRCTAAELDRRGLFLLPVSEHVLIRKLVGSLSEARRKLIGSWSIGIEREPKLWVLDLALRLQVWFSCTIGSCRKPVGRLSEEFSYAIPAVSGVFEIHKMSKKQTSEIRSHFLGNPPGLSPTFPDSPRCSRTLGLSRTFQPASQLVGQSVSQSVR